MYKRNVFDSQKELKIISKNNKEFFTKAKFGPSKITRIPLNINEELAFFVGAIIGDGHLKKSKLQISIELSNKNLIKYLRDICKNIFQREFNIIPVKIRKGKIQTFNMCMDSKSIYNLLKAVFEIPSGKKSNIVRVPKYIIKSNRKIKIAFLKGIMATEGGKRRRCFGLSTASKQMWKDLELIFNDVGIPISKDKWVHKKYKKEYYGISFKEQYMSLLEAGVPEWSNGLRLGRSSLVLA